MARGFLTLFSHRRVGIEILLLITIIIMVSRGCYAPRDLSAQSKAGEALKGRLCCWRCDDQDSLLLLFSFNITAGFFFSWSYYKMRGSPIRIAHSSYRWWSLRPETQGVSVTAILCNSCRCSSLKLLHVFKQIMTIIFSYFIIWAEIQSETFKFVPHKAGRMCIHVCI